MILDYYVSEMQRVRTEHDRLYSSIRTGNPDLTTIAEIFETSTFGRLQVRDITSVVVDNPYENV